VWRRLLDYEEVLAGDLARREAAGAGVPIILNWSGSVTIDGDTFGAGFVAGPAETYADTVNRGPARGVQVDLDLVAARHLVGRPLGELTGQVFAVEDVWGADGRRLMERLAQTPTAGRRTDVVADFLRTRPDPHPAPNPGVAAVTVLTKYNGKLSIGELAALVGVGRQHLHRLVTREFGLAPRTLGRLLRFQGVVDAVRAGRVVALADLAAAHGYYDQAHLHRDCRAFAGMTPAELLTRHSSNPATSATATVKP
jgi:AraC-like DNA-binding protein